MSSRHRHNSPAITAWEENSSMLNMNPHSHPFSSTIDPPPLPPPTPPPTTPKKKSKKSSSSILPHHKAGRVKVGIRCRPPFQEEVDKAKGHFVPVIVARPDSDSAALGKIILNLPTGKQREFMFDYVFGPPTAQDVVYDRVARPVVNDVLNGFNGTIFAYGQTGTGKTFTMGILDTVADESAGLIPRSISHIFHHVKKNKATMDIKVTMSFLQIYRENIQDLLSHSIVSGGTGGISAEDNLPIREDPHRGFYVEGLQEYLVHSYQEAEALLNIGLESRAIASTLMNSTSSRSHTVLTVAIEQRGDLAVSDDNPESATLLRRRSHGSARILYSKLLMVDLAGSERVRKTISKGARLDEAKSINTSLSALGNVIAALAESNTAHVPYRDSKLTRILNDSLGGTASTSLIATVGPAPSNYNETLSTLQFASRCMAVKSTPVQHEEVDYAELCTRLQQQVNSMETTMTRKLNEQQEKYEAIISELRDEIKTLKSQGSAETLSSTKVSAAGTTKSFNTMLQYFHSFDENGYSSMNGGWVQEMTGNGTSDQALLLLAFCFDTMKDMHRVSYHALKDMTHRAKAQKAELLQRLQTERLRDELKKKETENMASRDPLQTKTAKHIGSHLEQLSHSTALTKVEEHYFFSRGSLDDESLLQKIKRLDHQLPDNITDYETVTDLAKDMDSILNGVRSNLELLSTCLEKRDGIFRELKDDLMIQYVEKRNREEEVVNWSYILKYLLSTMSKLKQQIKDERSKHTDDSLPTYQQNQSRASNNNSLVSQRRELTLSGILEGNRVSNIEELGSLDRSTHPLSNSSRDESVLSDRGRSDRSGLDRKRDDDRLRSSGFRDASAPSTRSSDSDQSHDPSILPPPHHHQSLLLPHHHQQSFSLQRVQYRMRNAVSSEMDDRKRRNQAGKLGPRLAAASGVVSHNNAMLSASQSESYDSIGPPQNSDDEFNEVASTNESEANGSFRSAATVGSIPPHVSSRATLNHSHFAKSIVSDLGVEGHQAIAAMSVIDRVSNITEDQLRKLDPETREQIMQIRMELGLDQMGGSADPMICKGQRRNSETLTMRSSHPQNISHMSRTEFHRSRPPENIHLKQSQPHDPDVEDEDDDNYSQLDSELEWN